MSSAIENTPNDNDTDNPKDPSSNKSIAALSKKNSSITIVPRPAKTFPTNYESLDYDPLESQLEIEKEQKEDFFIFDVKTATRWTLALLIGVFTALIAFVCDVIIEELSDIKFEILEQSIENSLKEGKTYILLAYVYTVLSNIFFVAIGSLLVTYVEPVAGGSGIPQVKCYLNGVKVPHVLRCRTLFVKVAGVITSVVGGLAGGMEGPMIHAGAVVGGTISQSRNTKLVKDFRMDAEKRDFVSIGAASGVAAAFGAPIGGVLFSLEEGTSFWNQSLIWKTFFGTAMATLTLNLGLSLYMGHFGTLSHPGLISFGKVDAFPFEIYEMPIFVIFGMVGGLLGALWNQLNYKLAVFRKKVKHFLSVNKVKETITQMPNSGNCWRTK